MRTKTGSRPRPKSYEVGKGRPPKNTQWKPGQSGNPMGRPRGSKNARTILADALKKKIPIKERGRTRMITTYEGIVMRQVNLALNGNHKAMEWILKMQPEIAPLVHLVNEIPLNDPVEAAKTYARIMKTVEG